MFILLDLGIYALRALYCGGLIIAKRQLLCNTNLTLKQSRHLARHQLIFMNSKKIMEILMLVAIYSGP